MNRRAFLIIVVFSLGFHRSSEAQSSINSAGGDASGPAGSVAFSIGQVATDFESTSAGTMAEGVQHPFDAFMTSIPTMDSGAVFSLYPNPVAGDLIVTTEHMLNGSYTYRIIDVQGKAGATGILKASSTVIKTADLDEGTYFLDVRSDSGYRLTMKFIKIHTP